MFGAIALALTIVPAAACEGLRDGPKGLVTSVVDGDTLLLDNGLVVRLVGIQAPHLALGRPGLEDWPLGAAAKAGLEAMALNHKVRLSYGGAEKDRHGRVLAQVFLEDAEDGWVQQLMLREGLARVYTFADNRACAAELYAAEGRARTASLGIWADPYYRVRRGDRPAEFSTLAGRFEVIEGRVLKAAKSGGRLYLNFGRYYKEDVTAVIEAGSLRLFTSERLDPLRLGGALVRVRGWVELRDGPRITLTHPEQIEVLAVP